MTGSTVEKYPASRKYEEMVNELADRITQSPQGSVSEMDKSRLLCLLSVPLQAIDELAREEADRRRTSTAFKDKFMRAVFKAEYTCIGTIRWELYSKYRYGLNDNHCPDKKVRNKVHEKVLQIFEHEVAQRWAARKKPKPRAWLEAARKSRSTLQIARQQKMKLAR